MFRHDLHVLIDEFDVSCTKNGAQKWAYNKCDNMG